VPGCPSCPPGLRPVFFCSDRDRGGGFASPSPDGGMFGCGRIKSEPMPEGRHYGVREPVGQLQRRLHRSVTDTRRSVAIRPNESASTMSSIPGLGAEHS
jgi:hypothetical protein